MTKPLPKCPECEQTFKTVQVMSMHRANVHGIKGTSKSSLQLRAQRQRESAALANHLDERGRDLRCDADDCTYIAKTWNGLGVHRATAHRIAGATKTKQVHACDHCEQSFQSANGLAKHQAKMHGVPGQSKSAIQRRHQKEHSLAITAQTVNNGRHEAEEHRQAAADGIAPETLALALGRFQGLCTSMATEFDLPVRSFARRLAELIYHAQVRS
jgi:uncharacterized C2H2 Zn-finger protein